MDPRIRIHTKMSWIRNTVEKFRTRRRFSQSSGEYVGNVCRLLSSCIKYFLKVPIDQWQKGWVESGGINRTVLKQRCCKSSPLIEKTVRIGSPSLILSNNATIPSYIWTVGKDLIALFGLTTWLASFPAFFRSVNSLKRDLSIDTTSTPPIFSLANTF